MNVGSLLAPFWEAKSDPEPSFFTLRFQHPKNDAKGDFGLLKKTPPGGMGPLKFTFTTHSVPELHVHNAQWTVSAVQVCGLWVQVCGL